MKNAETVRRMYEAFAAGDVPALLACIAPDVVWDYGPSSVALPWLCQRHGHAGVIEFLQALTAFEFHRFEPRAIVEGPDGLVVGIVHVESTLKRNGERIVEPEEVHLFHFDATGRVARFRHQLDTHRMWVANSA